MQAFLVRTSKLCGPTGWFSDQPRAPVGTVAAPIEWVCTAEQLPETLEWLRLEGRLQDDDAGRDGDAAAPSLPPPTVAPASLRSADYFSTATRCRWHCPGHRRSQIQQEGHRPVSRLPHVRR